MHRHDTFSLISQIQRGGAYFFESPRTIALVIVPLGFLGLLALSVTLPIVGALFGAWTIMLVAILLVELPWPELAARRAQRRHKPRPTMSSVGVPPVRSEDTSASWACVRIPAKIAIGVVLLSATVAVASLLYVSGEPTQLPFAGSAAVVCALGVTVTLSGNVASLHLCRLGARARLCVLAAAAASGALAFAAAAGIASGGSPLPLSQVTVLALVAAAISTALVLLAGALLRRWREVPDLTLGSAEAGLLQDTLAIWFVVASFFVIPSWVDSRIEAGLAQNSLTTWLPLAAFLLTAATVIVWGVGNSFGHLSLEAGRIPPQLERSHAVELDAANDRRLYFLDRHLVRQTTIVAAGLLVGFALAFVMAVG